MTNYDRDLHAWAHEQARALRARSANEVDWENVAEEIDSLGRQQRAELRSRMDVLLLHILKWAYQPERRGERWLKSIREQRRKILRLIQDNPSLKPELQDVAAEAYADAREGAEDETGLPLDIFPPVSPFSLEDVMDKAWLPESAEPTDERSAC